MGWEDTIKPITPAAASTSSSAPGRKTSWEDTIKPIARQEEPGLLKQAGSAALAGVAKVGQALDSVTGAPTRAAIGAAQSGGGLIGAVAAYKRQFAEDPELAPTGKQIAEKAGLSKDRKLFSLPVIGDVSPAGLAGFGVDVLADPTNLIPGRAAVGIGAKAAKEGVELASKGAVAASKYGAKAMPVATKAVTNTADSVTRAVDHLVNPKVSDEFAELSAIAERNGLDASIIPSSGKYGEHSIISRGERVQREGPLGQPKLEEFHDNLTKVRDATDARIADIGRGAVYSEQEAGNYLKQAYDKAYDNFFAKIDTTYDSVVKDYPGLRITDEAQKKLDSTLSGIEKFAKGREKRGLTPVARSQAEGLLNAVAAYRESNGSVKQAVEALHEIGETAFKPRNVYEALPPDVQRMRKLYGELAEAIHTTIQTSVQDGQAISGALRINNKMMTDFFGNKSVIAQALGDPNKAPEGIFRSLVLSGDSRKIGALKEVLEEAGPDAMQPVKAAALNAIIKRTDDADFSFRQVKNAFRNKKGVFQNLLDPSEAKEFEDIVKLGDSWGLDKMSTSQTSAGLTLKNVKGEIGNALFNEALIEKMKQKASGIRPPAAAKVPFDLESELRKGLRTPRTKKDAALKGLQTYGAQSQNEDK